MEGTFSTRSGVPAVIKKPAAAAPKGSPFRAITAFYDALAARRFLFPITVFLVHYAIVQIAATLAYVYGTARSSSGPYESNLGPPRDMTGFWENLVGPLRLWDGLWYKQIAEKGYEYGTANAAFWPLLPWVMKYGNKLTGLQPEVVGYLFVNVCFVGALIVLNQLLRMDFSEALTRKALWAIALFPTALFFTAVYTEAPFLFFASLCLLCARKGEWPAAGVVGFFAALTRSQGVMLLAPLGILLIQQNGVNPKNWLRTAPFAALPVLGPALFALKLSRIDKPGYSWRSFIDVQNEWYRTGATPWKTLECATRGCSFTFKVYDQTVNPTARGDDWTWLTQLIRHPSWDLITGRTWIANSEYINWRDAVARGDTLELVITLIFIGLAIFGLFKLPLWQSAYVWPPLIVPLFQPSSVHPLFSMPRFVIVLFPLFVVLGMFIEGRWTKTIAVLVSTAMLVLLTIQFSTWYWVS